MAENFQQTIIGLQNAIDDLSGSIRDLGTQKLNRLLSSDEFKKANKSVRAVDAYDAARSVFIRAERIKKAKSAMRSDPERWESPSDWIRDDDRRIKGQAEMAARHKAFSIWHGRNYGRAPTGLIDRINQFGAEGGRVAFDQDFYDSYQAEFNPKEFQYEQDVKRWGHDKADTLKSERENRERRENKNRYMRLQASRRKAQREQLYQQAPWMKSLIQSGIIDKKYIPGMAKSVGKIAKLGGAASIAFGGGLASLGGISKLAGLGPVGIAGAIVAAVKIGSSLYGKYRLAAQKQQEELSDMGVSAKMFGEPHNLNKGFGRSFYRSALVMGKSEKDALAIYHRLQGEYGPATDVVLKNISNLAKGKEGWQRQQIAMEYGLSLNDLALIDLTFGNRAYTRGEANKSAAEARRRAQRDVTANGSAADRAVHWAGEKLFGDWIQASIADEIFEKSKEVQQGAINSANREQSEAHDSYPTDNSVSSVTINNNVSVNNGESVEGVVEAATNGALAATQRRRILDYNSEGYAA